MCTADVAAISVCVCMNCVACNVLHSFSIHNLHILNVCKVSFTPKSVFQLNKHFAVTLVGWTILSLFAFFLLFSARTTSLPFFLRFSTLETHIRHTGALESCKIEEVKKNQTLIQL